MIKELVNQLSIGSHKLEGEISAWIVGIGENLKKISPKVLLFTGLVISGYVAQRPVHFGVSTSSLFFDKYFLLSSASFVGALAILLQMASSPRHNVNVLDTSN